MSVGAGLSNGRRLPRLSNVNWQAGTPSMQDCDKNRGGGSRCGGLPPQFCGGAQQHCSETQNNSGSKQKSPVKLVVALDLLAGPGTTLHAGNNFRGDVAVRFMAQLEVISTPRACDLT